MPSALLLLHYDYQGKFGFFTFAFDPIFSNLLGQFGAVCPIPFRGNHITSQRQNIRPIICH
jgi:hypothetical protein